jgi:F-type H+-transporting ATPase subunit delta
MIGNAVSRRYASALFNLGKEKGELDTFAESLTAFASAIEENVQLKELMMNPVITHDEKKSIVMGVLGLCKAGTTEKNFFSLLADKGRLALIPAIIADFKAILDDAKGISRGLVTTAIELDNTKKSEIISQLEKQTGRKLDLSYAVDPKILGGIVLKVGDIVYDASLRAQLDNLRESIKRGE